MKDKRLERLIRKARRGDRDAFCSLVELKAERIFCISTYLMGNKADGEDAAQEAIIALGRDIGSLQKIESFDSWLYRIVFNVSIAEKNRKRKRARNTIEFEIAAETASETKTQFLPDENYDATMTSERLMKAITGLPERYRMCLLLYYFENMSYAEIADTMKVSEQVVANTLNRAKGKLRDNMTEQEEQGKLGAERAMGNVAVLSGGSLSALLSESSTSMLSGKVLVGMKEVAKTTSLSKTGIVKAVLETVSGKVLIATATVVLAAVALGLSVQGFEAPNDVEMPIQTLESPAPETNTELPAPGIEAPAEPEAQPGAGSETSAYLSGQPEGSQTIVLVEGEDPEAWQEFWDLQPQLELVQEYSENGFMFSVYQMQKDGEFLFYLTTERINE